MKRDHSRAAEGSLLVLALLILASGMWLAYLARAFNGPPADSVNLNRASTEELSLALSLDPEIAVILVKQRERIGGFSSVRQPARLSLFPDRAEAARLKKVIAESGLDVNNSTARDLERVLGVSRAVSRRIVEYRQTLRGGRFRRPADAAAVPPVDDKVLAALGPRLVVRSQSEVFGRVAGGGLAVAVLLVAGPFLLRRAGVRGDPFLAPIALVLGTLGVVAMLAMRDPLREPLDFLHHVGGLWLGMAGFVAGASIPARNSRFRWLPARSNLRHYTYLWALLAMLLTLALWRLGHGPEGVRLSLGFFQPIEIVKLLLIFFVAGYLNQHGDALADSLHRWRPPLPKGLPARFQGISLPRREDLLPMLVMFGAALSLFLIVHDMGPALLLFGAFVVTLYVATGRSGIVWLGIALALAGGILAWKLKFGVVPVRVEMWLSPWNNPHPNGMQLGQSMWAMASGGLFGTGLGLGATGTIPRGRDDLAFSALGEELGAFGALVILALYTLLIGRGMKVALHAQTDFDRLLATGLTALFACQTFLIVGGVTGLLPLTGITLPFVSYGNTSLVADFFLLGLLRGISAPTHSVPIGASNPLFGRTLRRTALVSGIAFLGVIGIARIGWIQAIASDRIAANTIRTPDADGTPRSKLNPRLLALERSIQRGSIYDRKGRVLATSRLNEISAQSPDDPDAARRRYRRGRYYPYGAQTAHAVGYIDPAIGGPAGLEREYNRELRGFDNYADLVRDFRVKDLPGWLGRLLTGHGKRAGANLYATLDADLQENSFRILRQAAGALRDKRTGKRKDRAALVVLDPATGEVLALVSTPSFDPNGLTPKRMAEIQANRDLSSRLVARARYGLYPPGSSLKVAVAAAGLEEGLEPVYDCNHVAQDVRWTYKGRVYMRRQLQDDKGDPPHNRIGMARAVEVSCNLYFANLGIQLGTDRLHAALEDRFEMRSLKPAPEFAVDLAQNAFGQGTVLASPLEMARIAGNFANRGRMMKPYYARELKEADGRSMRQFAPAVMSRPVGERNAARIAEMMRSVVTRGTARGVFSGLPVEVAGKTGTAQTEQGDGEPHSWFIGFTPYSRPQYAFACIIENGGYGKQSAAPAVNRVLRTLFR